MNNSNNLYKSKIFQPLRPPILNLILEAYKTIKLKIKHKEELKIENFYNNTLNMKNTNTKYSYIDFNNQFSN